MPPDLNPIKAIIHWNRNLIPRDRAAKFAKMRASPLAFYRGTNHLFWAAFADDARLRQFGHEGTRIWIQGDLHAFNYGAYHNDDEEIVYGLNDFDEALIADYQYDLWRMAASLVLIARENELGGQSEASMAITAFCETYLDVLAGEAQVSDPQTEQGAYGRLDEFLEDTARSLDREKMLKQWTAMRKGERRFDLDNGKLEALDTQEREAVIHAMQGYRQSLSGGLDYDPDYFRIKDIARRILAGNGSLGTPRYYLLIAGARGDDNERILDVKRQDTPTACRFLDAAHRTAYRQAYTDDAARHTRAMKALCRDTDDHLGHMSMLGAHYSVRERSPFKATFPLKELSSAERLQKLSAQWGHLLALSHARAERDAGPGFVENVLNTTRGRRGECIDLIQDVALSFADRVIEDWRAFCESPQAPDPEDLS